MVDLVQDRKQAVVLPPDGKGHVHGLAGGERRQLVFRQHVPQIADAVVAYDAAIRFLRRNGTEAGIAVVVKRRLPLGEVIHQEALIAGVSLDEGRGDTALRRNAPGVRRPDGCVHLGADIGVGDDDPSLLAVIGADTQGEHAVNFALLHGLQRFVRAPEGPGLKTELGVLFTGLGKIQVIRQRTGQFVRPGVLRAEGQKAVPIAHTDRAVVLDPVHLFGGEEAVDGAGLVELFGHLLVKVAVVLKDAVHRDIQILLQVRAVFVDAEVGIRGADLAHRHDVGRVAVGVQRDQHVDLAAEQHLDHLRRLDGQLDDLGRDVVLFGPVDEELLLNAALVDADALAVHGGEVVRPNFGVVGRDEDMVVLRAHRLGGIEDLPDPIFLIGHVAQQVNLTGHQLFKQLGPAALDILIGPAGVDGDALLILIAVARFPAEGIGAVEGRLVPADADRLLLFPEG